MMVVVPTLPPSDHSQKEAVATGVTGCIASPAYGVPDRVNREGHVIEDRRAEKKRDSQ